MQFRCLSCALVLAMTAFAGDPQAFSVLVERVSGQSWNLADPATIFRAGDEIRFRVRSSEPGFLYILNESERGLRTWIYPPAGAATENRIDNGREYVVPNGEAAFRVGEQPGYDSVYYVLTSVRLPSLPSALPPTERTASKSSLLPRCADGSLRARGLCTDQNAGARRVEPNRQPEWVAKLIPLAGKIFIYELRLAHR
jgi:hypothetical protein